MPTLSQMLPAPGSNTPIYYDPDFPLMFGAKGAWQIYSYNTVLQVLSDYRNFSNAYMPTGEHNPIGSNLNQTDPPLHSILRSIVAGPFKREAIKQWGPRIQERCSQLLANALEKRELDFVTEVAFPLSAAVICDIMGIPGELQAYVNSWAKVVVTAGYSPNGLEKAAAAQQEMAQLFYGLLQERSSTAGSDVLTLIAQGSTGNGPLPPEIQVGSCMTILLAGHETTAALLSNALYLFIQVPGLWQLLQQDPSLIPGALSEALRLRPSLVSMYRIAATDTQIEGQVIRKGELVNAWISTANRDPEVFAQPEDFNPGRENFEKVLSFGKGVHHCLGDHLAKAEARACFELLLSKVATIEITAEPTMVPSAIANGFEHLPVRITAKP